MKCGCAKRKKTLKNAILVCVTACKLIFTKRKKRR